MTLAQRQGIASIAFPVIGAGSGGFGEDQALRLMHETLADIDAAIDVRIVRYRPQASR